MAGTDTRTYGYSDLDDFGVKVKQAVQNISDEVDAMQAETNRLLGSMWSGDSAAAYNQKSDDINTKLVAFGEQAQTMAQKVATGSGDMQDTDRSGRGKF